MSAGEQSVLTTVRGYYNSPQTVHKFSIWGPDPKRPGVSAAHLGLDDVERFHRNIFRLPFEIRKHRKAVEKMTSLIVEESQVEDGQSVLDAGCGTGPVAFPIAERNRRARVYGANISRGQLEIMQKYQRSAGLTNVYLTEQNYTRMAFRDEAFDRVVFAESFCHAPNKAETVREVGRVLKPGGKVLIVDIIYLKSPTTDQERARQALESVDGLALLNLTTIDELVGLLKESGMEKEFVLDVSERSKASLALIANGYVDALSKETAEPSPLIDSYLAAHSLTQQGTLGYAFIRAVKL